MSKMREVFEALYVTVPGNIKPDSEEWHVELLWRVFEAGYQAAITAVKEGGAVAYIYAQDQGHGRAHLSYSKPEWQDPDAMAQQEIVITNLYKLPEEDTP